MYQEVIVTRPSHFECSRVEVGKESSLPEDVDRVIVRCKPWGSVRVVVGDGLGFAARMTTDDGEGSNGSLAEALEQRSTI
jgi:hypothetical protein